MNRSAKGEARSGLHVVSETKAFSFTHRAKVIAGSTVGKNSV